ETDVQPPAEPEPQPAAEAEEGAPAELLSAAAEATPSAEAVAAPTAPAGTGYLVQLSSQRTEEQARASFADLQRRFGSVLGQLEADIQQADLGEKGIYYRVRVGPWATRGEAIEVCESLQAAGGSCFVAQ